MLSQKSEATDWVIREVIPDDISFIYASWSNAIKHGSDLGICCRPALFFRGFTLLIDKIVTDDKVKILVACLPNDPDVILGFTVYYPNTVHFIFVKRPFQRLGIATSLYKAAGKPLCFTMKTSALLPIEEKLKDMIYIPFQPNVTFEQQGEVNGQRSKA